MDHRRVCGRYKMEGAILRGVCASSSAPRSSLDPCEVVPLQRHALVLREIVAREERLDVRERRLVVVVVRALAAVFDRLDPRRVVPLQGHALLLREIVAREQRLDVRERRLFAVVVSLLAARRRDAMRSRADRGTVGFAV